MELNDNGEGGIWVFDEVELPDGWAFDQLGNRCTVRRGSSPRPAGHPRYFGGGTIPWIKIGDATNTGSRFIESTAEHVNEEGAKCSVLIPAGSLIIANSGVSLGFAAITRVPGCIHDGWLLTTDFRELDRDYLYYCINIATRRLRQLADGTTQPNLNTGIARRLMLPLPPLAEQKAIAAVLGALDDKIELNRRMNATLEATARALFQSWFVDFDPVRAKLDGRQPSGLDPATVALFPNEFEDSKLGPIPKGWTAGTVIEEFNLTMGQSPPSTSYNEEGRGIPLYQGKTDFGFRFPTRRIFCTAPTRYAKTGDTLVSVRAPVGDINMASEECCVGRGVAAVRHKTGATSFTYYSMSHLYPDFARFEAEGTVFGSINKDSFEKLPFVIPPPQIVAAYERRAAPLDEQISTLENQSRTLAVLRDTMLPKLLSGDLSVDNGTRV